MFFKINISTVGLSVSGSLKGILEIKVINAYALKSQISLCMGCQQ